MSFGPVVEIKNATPTFLRLSQGRTPDVERYFGIKKGTLYNLHDQGKIKGVVLRKAGSLKGVRLWHMASVREYIFTQMECSASFAPR